MNGLKYSDLGIYGMPQEVEEIIINIIRTTPRLSIPIIHLIYKIAVIAFDAGLNKAMLHLEETNLKLQSLAN